MIAEVLQTAGRADDAIAVYRDFIATKGFRLPGGDAATTIEKELRAAPATHLANLKIRALFRSGQILASQKSNNDNWNQQRRQGQQKSVLRYAWKLVSNPPDRA